MRAEARLEKRKIARNILLSTAVVGAAVLAAPASAGPKPRVVQAPVMTTAWYNEKAESRSVDLPVGTIQLDTNNEYCPKQPSGGGANASNELCAEGRLPIRIVGGDYKSPDQVSAVAFDTLLAIPIGSKVKSFKATFIEAKGGCRDSDTSATGKQCEGTEPINVEGHKLQACLVTEQFGEGEARPYKEQPKAKCTKRDPTAKRRKVKLKGKTEHAWTFDLTKFAKKWASGKMAVSAVLLTGAPPKNTGPNDSWRVVLDGPMAANGRHVTTKAVIIPPKTPSFIVPTIPPPGPGGTETTFVPGTPGTPGSPGTPAVPGAPGTTTSTGGTTGGTTGAAEPGEAKAPVDAPAEEPKTEAAAANEGPAGGGLPGYAWLALLAGLVGFSLVRQAVLEKATGIRPDGVLAQIQRLNAQRRGGPAPAVGATTGPAALFATVAGTLAGATRFAGTSISNLLSKIRGSRSK